jgi:S-(hydroxymethyl)glutathione dehydrogenase/alcohol dehydrogenase
VVNNDAHLKIGESVAIFGVGGVGLNLVQFAALAGGHPIVAVDLLDHKLEMARARGATHIINSAKMKDTEIADAIREIVGKDGPDKVFETTGVKSVIENAYELAHKDGTCVLIGVPHEKVTINTLRVHFNMILTGSEGGSSKPDIDIPRIIRLVKAGRLSFDGIITDEFALDDINPAFDLVRSGKAGRVLIRV